MSTRGVRGVLSSGSAPSRRAGQGSTARRATAARSLPAGLAPALSAPCSFPLCPGPPAPPGAAAPLRRQGAARPPRREGVWRAGEPGFPFPHGFPSRIRVWKQPRITSPEDLPGERRAARRRGVAG